MNSSDLLSLQACAANPWHFLTHYVMTEDPAHGVCRYPDYDYLAELLWVMHSQPMLLVPKSRQMLVTWSVVAYFLWRALFRQPGMYLFISRNERCAEELLERTRFILDHLPVSLRPRRVKNSREEIEIAKLGTRILLLPASPHGPRMYSPAGVFWDEMAFTPFDEDIWTALKPALDSGGRFVGVSSSGGAANLFAHLVRGAKGFLPLSRESRPDPAGGSGPLVHLHPVHYSAHPERNNEGWKRRAMAGLSLAKWEQEQEISFDCADNLVYSEFTTARHVLPQPPRVDRRHRLYRSIDFGYRCPFVLWFMLDGEGNVVVFDEWSERDRSTGDMLRAIAEKDSAHGIGELDIDWTACDPAGGAVPDAGISPVDVLRRRGMKLRFRPSRIGAGVECVRHALRDARGQTRLYISPRCVQLIADFRRYKWDVRRDEPLKDGLSDHSMDALRYFFVNLETPDERDYVARVTSCARL